VVPAGAAVQRDKEGAAGTTPAVDFRLPAHMVCLLSRSGDRLDQVLLAFAWAARIAPAAGHAADKG